MKFILLVICAVIGTVYSRSVPMVASDTLFEVETLSSGNPVHLIRRVRQFDGRFGNGRLANGGGGGGGEQYNDFDYNPYNDSPRNYDGNPFNDSTHRQLYNNFDQNRFNNSPNDYDDEYFRRRFNL